MSSPPPSIPSSPIPGSPVSSNPSSPGRASSRANISQEVIKLRLEIIGLRRRMDEMESSMRRKLKGTGVSASARASVGTKSVKSSSKAIANGKGATSTANTNVCSIVGDNVNIKGSVTLGHGVKVQRVRFSDF